MRATQVGFGTPILRKDGLAKVTGAARFSSDEPVANPAYAYLVTSAIARGHIGGFNLDRARAVRGRYCYFPPTEPVPSVRIRVTTDIPGNNRFSSG